MMIEAVALKVLYWKNQEAKKKAALMNDTVAKLYFKDKDLVHGPYEVSYKELNDVKNIGLFLSDDAVWKVEIITEGLGLYVKIYGRRVK